MRSFLVGLIALAASGVPAHTPPVSDLADVLDASQEAEVASIAAAAAADGTVVLEVLTVGSMADYGVGNGTIESFAQGVFDTWGIGDAAQDDGALIVVAVDDRETRIELGAGFSGAYDGAMATVMNEVMLPHFRVGDYGGGIVEGARRIVERLAGPADVSAPIEPAAGGGSGGGGGSPWGLIGAGVVAIAGAGGTVAWRRRPRKCPLCGAACALVGEADDDVFLDDGQRCEEFLDSVDHRAWKCPSCNHVELTHHRRLFSRSKNCAACGYRTAQSSKQTVSAATYSSSGTAIVTTTCANQTCRHRSERTITLPRLQHTSTGGGSRGFSSSSHSSGGGRSGGGGASGKW